MDLKLFLFDVKNYFPERLKPNDRNRDRSPLSEGVGPNCNYPNIAGNTTGLLSGSSNSRKPIIGKFMGNSQKNYDFFL